MGFILIFSALFAKIRRVRLVVRNATHFRRVTVKARDVGLLLVLFLSVPFIILLCWQLIDPLQWERQITRSNNFGFALETVGFCNSDHAVAFLIPLAVYDFGCLLYALYLCYRTRNFSSEMNEAKWITASIISILQVLLLAVPVLVIAWADANVFFFIRACVVFLISFGVTLFIFLPKFLQLHVIKEELSQEPRRRSMYISGSFAGVEQAMGRPSLLQVNLHGSGSTDTQAAGRSSGAVESRNKESTTSNEEKHRSNGETEIATS